MIQESTLGMVVDEQQKISVINAVNLIGDSLYSIMPLRYFSMANKKLGRRTIILTGRGLVHELFQRSFADGLAEIFVDGSYLSEEWGSIPPISLSAGLCGHICYEGEKQYHISDGYMRLLGLQASVKLPMTPPMWLSPILDIPYDAEDMIAISPFSSSSDPKNPKILDEKKWNPIMRFLRSQCKDFRILAGPGDRFKHQRVSEDEYVTVSSLAELGGFMRKCKLLVSVDNGMAHLATAVRVPTIVFWPPMVGKGFIAPLFHPDKVVLIEMGDPRLVQPGNLLQPIKTSMRHIMD